jgi:putative MFS transporter
MSASVGAVPVQDAIDRIGFGRFQKRLLGVCGVTWAADAAEIFLIAFALPVIAKDFGLSTFQSSLVVSSTFVGMLAGAWFWGTISDRIGRRRGFTLTIGIFAIFGLASAFSPNVVWLCVFRILAGFGLGGAVPLDFSLFAEYLPTRNRGRWLVILESFWAVGTIVAAALAWLLVPTLGWRALLATSALAGALIFWVRLRIPESPRYLAAKGRIDEAEEVLRRVAAENGMDERDVPRVQAPRAVSDKVEISRLFKGRMRRTTVMLWSTWFFIALAYYGLFSWLPKTFAEQGFDVVTTYGYVLLLAVAQLPGYFSAAWLVERWGRKRTFVTYLLASAGFTFLYGAAASQTLLVAAAVLMSFFALGAWACLYAYTPELLPTAMRTTGMGAASGMARIAGVLAPILGGLLLPVSLGLTLSAFAVAFALAALSVAILGTETREVALADTVGEEEGVPEERAEVIERTGRFDRDRDREPITSA